MTSAFFKGIGTLAQVAVASTALVALQATALPVANCYVQDFNAGVPNYADDCYIGGETSNNATEADINSIGWGTGWTFSGLYETDGMVQQGDVTLSVQSLGGSEFAWSFPDSQFDFEDAVFVVKQSSYASQGNPGGWVAYLFEPLENNEGSFSTGGSFQSDTFSNLRLFTRGSKPVPEMDVTGAGLAAALLAGIFALFRERRA